MAEKQGNCNVIYPKRTTTSRGLTIIINSTQAPGHNRISKTFRTSVRMSAKLYFFISLVSYSVLYDVFPLHSSCRLSYRRPSTWTAMFWLSLTTCSYTTIPSMGEGLADSTLQKVRLLIWRMVGTFLHLIICYAPFSLSFFQTSSHSTNHTPSCF